MKRTNLPLIIGTLILVMILLIAVFPGFFTDNSPYTIQLMRFIHEDGKLDAERAPFLPDKDHPFGTDDLGRDVLSYIIYGTRLTIALGILIAIGQFAVAVPLAILGGFGNRLARSIILQFNVVFSAIPALLISLILLKLDYIAGLDKKSSVTAFVLILTAVSWPKLGSLVMERVEAILNKPFIKGERAIGKRRSKIALENVVPHLAPELTILFFMEIARNLSLLMQLGIFAIFVGNLGIINDSTSGVNINTDISFEPEWASMLSTSRTLISTAPWAVMYPALAFFISVLGFNLFGEGIRKQLQSKDSRMTLIFRKLISFDFKYLLRMINSKKRLKYFISIVLISLAMITINHLTQTDYSINLSLDRNELPDSALIGTRESEELSYMISNKMGSLGLDPLKDNFLIEYPIGSSYLINKQSLWLHDQNGSKEFVPNLDYSFISTGDIVAEGTILDTTSIDLFNIESYERFNGNFILIDKVYYNDMAIEYFINEIKENSRIEGVLLIARQNEELQNLIVSESKDIPTILLSRETAEYITAYPEAKILARSSVETLGSSGANVVGILRGKDKNFEDEAIVIGMNYNYLTEKDKDVLRFNLEVMEKLCTEYNNKRSIIFMFLDGTTDEERHGIYYMAEDFPYSPNKVQAYIDLTGITLRRFDYIQFSSAQAPLTRPFAWSLGHRLGLELEKAGFQNRGLETVTVENELLFTESYADNVMFWQRGIPTVIVNASVEGAGKRTVEELGSIILKVISENNY
ncbi:MAG TPA: ABC transporter permease subunit [Gudongella oleilytica]|nr:ABC transporter permease subunit [Gudongella oleilytica]